MDLDPERIERAAHSINPVFLHSPQFIDDQLGELLGRELVVKLETANPLRSFKGRGADFHVGQLTEPRTLVCATAGNFGQAVAYAGAGRGLPVDIFVDPGVHPAKVDRMRAFGARVTIVDGPAAAMPAARAYAAAAPDRLLVEDGKEAAIAEGAGTIGLELLAGYRLDTIVVPVGDGALVNGIACWAKANAPNTRVVGVCASGAPAMAHAWRGEPVTDRTADTIAGPLVALDPAPESVRRMRALVDDMVLVDDDALRAAMRTAADTMGVLLEPAGAAAIAAVATHGLPGDRLAVILTGGSPAPELIRDVLSR